MYTLHNEVVSMLAARSYWGQKILQPGHLDALFSSKKLTTFLVALKTQAANEVSQSK